MKKSEKSKRTGSTNTWKKIDVLAEKILTEIQSREQATQMLLQAIKAGDERGAKLALKNGAYVNYRGKITTPLLEAVRNGSVRLTKLLLRYGADPNLPDEFALTYPIIEAAVLSTEKNALALTALLLSHGADPGVKDAMGKSAMDKAITKGYTKVVRLLFNYCPLDRLVKALDLAIKVHETKIAFMFLDYPEILSHPSETPALVAAAETKNLSLLRAILRRGVDPNVRNNEGQTALMICAKNGFLKGVKFLLSLGADLNLRDENSYTALHYAVESGKEEVVLALLKAGAEIEARNNLSATPLMLAVMFGFTHIVKALIRAGADVNTCLLPSGKTASMVAIERKWKEIIPLLIKAGANLDIQDRHGKTAWDYIADQEILEIVERSVQQSQPSSQRRQKRFLS